MRVDPLNPNLTDRFGAFSFDRYVRSFSPCYSFSTGSPWRWLVPHIAALLVGRWRGDGRFDPSLTCYRRHFHLRPTR